MNTRSFVYVLSALAMLSPSGPTKSDPVTHTAVPGFFDPTTRTFTALEDSPNATQPTSSAFSTASKVVQGTMTVTVVITGPNVSAITLIGGRGKVSGGSSNGDIRQRHTFGFVEHSPTSGGSGATITEVSTFPYNLRVDGNATRLSVGFDVTIKTGTTSKTSTTSFLNFSRDIQIPANGSATKVSFQGAV